MLPNVNPDFVLAEYDKRIADLSQLPEPHYPIYIPSRGRSSTALTPKALDASGLRYKVVIEPQDEADYKKHFTSDQILVMEKNNQGIAYVRNFCKDHAKLAGAEYHWQFDDNIKSFAIRENDKNIPRSAREAIALIESVVDSFDNIAAAGMKHQAFAFAERKTIGFNRQVYTAMLLSTKPEHRFRDGVIEDADYNLQVLFAGYCVLLFNRVVMNKVTSMVMAGGNTEISHANGGREQRAIATQRMWPHIFKLKPSKDGPRLAPSRVWSSFIQMPEPKNG